MVGDLGEPACEEVGDRSSSGHVIGQISRKLCCVRVEDNSHT